MKSYETINEDQNFLNGICFNVKLIGSMEISRPTSRVEIVAAMRRVRFEFKAKGVKKKKVTVTISTDNITTTLRHKAKRKRRTRSSSQVQYKDVDKNNVVLIHHPIYRIFYVCHDSQDVKVFSYISRETSSNVFNCSVFKASKKSQALKIVKTVGEAFEVSHKLTASPESNNDDNDVFVAEEKPLATKPEAMSVTRTSSAEQVTVPATLTTTTTTTATAAVPLLMDDAKEVAVDPEQGLDDYQEDEPEPKSIKDQQQECQGSYNKSTKEHEVQLLKEKLDAQTQNTQAALAQIHLLRDQLAAESNARIEAQSRTHQLLQQNRELLDHLQSLMRHIHELEMGGQKGPFTPQHVPLPQVRSGSPSLSSSTTATPPLISSFQELDNLRRQNLLDSMYFDSRYRLPPTPFYSPPFGFFNGNFYSPQQPAPNYYAPPPPLPTTAHPCSAPSAPTTTTIPTPEMASKDEAADKKDAQSQFILPMMESLRIPKLSVIGRKISAEEERRSAAQSTTTLGRSLTPMSKIERWFNISAEGLSKSSLENIESGFVSENTISEKRRFRSFNSLFKRSRRRRRRKFF